MAPRVGVVLFPGTNCEYDALHAVERLGGTAELLWHGATSASGYDALILPGGFAHGDYLRPGAIARFSPVMDAVAAFASEGGPVVGICNGFQVLTEAGLLPGALQKNRGLRFVCATTTLRVERDDTALTAGVPVGTELAIPINHPNGSVDDIAGVCNAGRNVVGLMPHPERASDPLLGSEDGIVLLQALLRTAATPAPVG